MEKLKNIKWKHYINYVVIAICTIVFGSMAYMGMLTTSTIYLVEKIAIAVMLAVSLSIVVGFLGELSLGHAGFMCVGAYLGGKVAVLLEGTLGNGYLTMIIAIIVGAVAAGICGIIATVKQAGSCM